MAVMILTELVNAMERLAPTRHAESWDNVGLLVGDPAQDIRSAMLTIDYTAEVAREAQAAGCDVVIAYHPPIFDGLKRIIAPSLIHDAIRRGVAIYSPHTALDVAPDGTNDMLADAIGLVERHPLRLAQLKAANCKLIVFAPDDAADRVADAMFAAGAGRIGNYTRCSFRSPGTGTFLGEQGTKPSIGRPGQLERVQELRMETIVPLGHVDAIVRAMRQAHPYEEPAFDVVPLAAPPEGLGQGRIGSLAVPTDRPVLLDRIKEALGVDHLLVAGPTDGAVSRAAACAGACGGMIDDALAQGAELYLTGEVRHHDALRVSQRGMTVVCTLHSNSERAVLRRLSRVLAKELPALGIRQSSQDRDPFALK